MSAARSFSRECVAAPHHRAAAIGADVLRGGGNAVDAAVATNLALGVLMPWACGFGGDLFALVWDGTEAVGVDGAGRSPAAATLDAVRERAGGTTMPIRGPLSITVPGGIHAWFRLLERFGTRTFGDLAAPALQLAQEGFALDDHASASLRASTAALAGFGDWESVYAGAADAGFLRQADLARTIQTLAEDGPSAFYGGAIGDAVVAQVRRLGGLLERLDLGLHRTTWTEPLRAGYRGHEVLELPPPTQGVSALEALRILERLGPLPDDPGARVHRLVEASKAALVDRHEHVTDPRDAATPAAALLADEWIATRAKGIDPSVAARPAPARPVPGGTVYLCAADADGMMVSLSQSNFMGFGSGVTVPGWGINLHNRGAYFRLDGQGADVMGPRRQPMHTLIPAMTATDGVPTMAFGTMGGDNQVQIQLQLLTQIVDEHVDLQDAIDAPRWSLSPSDWSVAFEQGADASLATALRERGHVVASQPATPIGWAQALRRDAGGWLAASDQRSSGGTDGT